VTVTEHRVASVLSRARFFDTFWKYIINITNSLQTQLQDGSRFTFSWPFSHILPSLLFLPWLPCHFYLFAIEHTNLSLIPLFLMMNWNYRDIYILYIYTILFKFIRTFILFKLLPICRIFCVIKFIYSFDDTSCLLLLNYS